MKTSNLYKAPKSTIIGLLILVLLAGLLVYGKLDNATFGTIAVVVVPLVFTDTLGENKKSAE